MYDETWEDFRESCLVEGKKREESVIKQWLDKISFKGTVGYSIQRWDQILTIYTNRPGMLIGSEGSNIPVLKTILSDEFGGDDWNIRFKEILSGFVTT